MEKGNRVVFHYGKNSIGYGTVQKVYKRKPPKIKLDKTVPAGVDIRDVKV